MKEITKGKQANIRVEEVRHVPVIRKRIEIADRASEYYQALLHYREDLQAHDIRVPRLEGVELDDTGITTTEEFIPSKDVAQNIEGRVNGWEQELHMVVDTVCRLSNGTQSSVFIDAKPDNWIVHKGRLHFIDLFPPPLKGKDGHVKPYTEEIYGRPKGFFTFTYGDIRGQITKLLAVLKLTDEDAYRKVATSILDRVTENVTGKSADYIKDQDSQGYPDLDAMYRDEAVMSTLIPALLWYIS